jgi:hypothetical protein
LKTRSRPDRWLTAATILVAISLLSSIDAQGEVTDLVGDGDDDAEMLSASPEPVVCDATLSHSHDPVGVHSRIRRLTGAPWHGIGIRRPAGITHLVLPASRAHVSAISVSLFLSRAPPSC